MSKSSKIAYPPWDAAREDVAFQEAVGMKFKVYVKFKPGYEWDAESTEFPTGKVHSRNHWAQLAVELKAYFGFDYDGQYLKGYATDVYQWTRAHWAKVHSREHFASLRDVLDSVYERAKANRGGGASATAATASSSASSTASSVVATAPALPRASSALSTPMKRAPSHQAQQHNQQPIDDETVPLDGAPTRATEGSREAQQLSVLVSQSQKLLNALNQINTAVEAIAKFCAAASQPSRASLEEAATRLGASNSRADSDDEELDEEDDSKSSAAGSDPTLLRKQLAGIQTDKVKSGKGKTDKRKAAKGKGKKREREEAD